MNIWDTLPTKPFFVLAPMYDVTDTVFRQIIADCAAPDVFFTEFVNVDALQSVGRDTALKHLTFTPKEKPLIAQLWGMKPENFQKSAEELVKMGYDGIDLNFGCPDKSVVKIGACIALINNRELAVEIIRATKAGAGSLPVSVKTRLGFNEIDFSWQELLLQQKLNALTIHGRTRSEMSKVPVHWEAVNQIRQMRDDLSPATKIIGNGDILTRQEGIEMAEKYQFDGIMIGRGVFHDPFVFAPTSPWADFTKEQKLALYQRHVQLFINTWQRNERSVHTLNKFCKIYVNGFDGAKEMREILMQAKSAQELMSILNDSAIL